MAVVLSLFLVAYFGYFPLYVSQVFDFEPMDV